MSEEIDIEDELDCKCWEEYGESCDECDAYAEDLHIQHLIDVWKDRQAGIMD